jgi:hypothetical protein
LSKLYSYRGYQDDSTRLEFALKTPIGSDLLGSSTDFKPRSINLPTVRVCLIESFGAAPSQRKVLLFSPDGHPKTGSRAVGNVLMPSPITTNKPKDAACIAIFGSS